MRNLSPLRYPGGKVRLAPFFAQLLAIQDPVPTRYAEPFAGGAGAALRLLDEERVSTSTSMISTPASRPSGAPQLLTPMNSSSSSKQQRSLSVNGTNSAQSLKRAPMETISPSASPLSSSIAPTDLASSLHAPSVDSTRPADGSSMPATTNKDSSRASNASKN